MNKVILVMLFVLLFALPFVFSQTQCKSDDELAKDMSACKESGLSYETFAGDDGCKFVKCVAISTPTIAQPGTTSNCPSAEQLNADIASCKAKGAYYDIVPDASGCKVVKCYEQQQPTVVPVCQTSDQLNKDIMACKEKGYSYDTGADAYGCKIVKCVESSQYAATPTHYCPTQEELDKYIGICKSKGLNYDMVPDAYGCKTVKCLEQFKTTQTSVPASTAQCNSDAEITNQIVTCKEKGGIYDIGIDASGCKIIKCSPIVNVSTETVTSEQKCQSPYLDDLIKKCKESNLGYEYYMESAGCESVRCKTQQVMCPNEDNLYEIIKKCKLNNMGYKYYSDSMQCKQVQCVEAVCPSEKEVLSKIEACKQVGMEAQTYPDHASCKMVKCYQGGTTCPAPEAVNNIVAKCKEKKLDFEVYEQNGCKQVKCKEPIAFQTIECKKYLQDNCTIISCTDGYFLNTCKLENVCPVVDCKTFKDDKGCIVKRCSNGYETRECNTETPVECKVYTREDGCTVKKCTDGQEYVSCPKPQVQCKEYKNESGCIITECTDGAKKKYCPNTTQNVECKVYKDDAGCEIKECTNGYKASNCEKPAVKCKDAKDDKGCIIKECEDGTSSKICPTTTIVDSTTTATAPVESVECKEYKSPEGCKIKVCTDGFEAKDCPVKELFQKFSAEVATSQTTTESEGGQAPLPAQVGATNIFFGLFKWLGSFFGGK